MALNGEIALAERLDGAERRDSTEVLQLFLIDMIDGAVDCRCFFCYAWCGLLMVVVMHAEDFYGSGFELDGLIYFLCPAARGVFYELSLIDACLACCCWRKVCGVG